MGEDNILKRVADCAKFLNISEITVRRLTTKRHSSTYQSSVLPLDIPKNGLEKFIKDEEFKNTNKTYSTKRW